MTSVADGFETFLARLALTVNQKAIADGRIAHLDSYFRNNISCATYPEAIGSYKRNTVIRLRRDIDVLVALAYDPYWARYGDDSAAMLRWLRDKLNAVYGATQVSTRQVAIRMFLGEGLQVDLVPTFQRKGGGFLMPNGSGSWRSTNPPFHATLMTTANVKLDMRLKPLVRLMKAWNETNGRHLLSFHLEMMVWEMWHDEDKVPAYANAVTTTLRKLTIWLTHPMRDPWTGSGADLAAYLSDSERAIAIRNAEADHKRAVEALNYAAEGKIKAAYERWGIIFPGQFPAYV